jgi:hypothetical protein
VEEFANGLRKDATHIVKVIVLEVTSEADAKGKTNSEDEEGDRPSGNGWSARGHRIGVNE